MKYHFKIHKEPKGFWAECLELKGCQTQADSEAELNKNMKTALNLFLSEPSDSSVIFSLPKKSMTGAHIAAVSVDPKVAFSFYLRRLRLKKGYTQKETAKLMGFKNLYSYQRLESSNANPELATIIQIKQVFPEFSIDAVLAA